MKYLYLSQKILLFCGLVLSSFTAFNQFKSYNLQKTEKQLGISDGLSNRQINSTFIDSRDRIWFLTDNKIGLFQYGKINNFQLSETFSNRGFNSAHEDTHGNFWISENFEWYYPFNVQRCLIFNPNSHKTTSLEDYIHQKIAIHSIVSDAQHQLFIGTKDGKIFRFDAKKKKLELLITFAPKPIKLLLASKQGIFACLEDNSVRDQALVQVSYEGKLLSKKELQETFVRSMFEFENRLLYVTLKTKKIDLNEYNGSFSQIFPTPAYAYLSNIKFAEINKMVLVNDGKSVSFYDRNFRLIFKQNYDFEIHDIIEDTNGNFILSTNNGVTIFKLGKNKILTLLKNNEPEKLNDNFSCRKILKINDRQIIVNTNKKRQLIDLNTGVVKPLHDFKNDDESNPHFVLSSLKDKNGDLLFGEDALVKTDLKTNKDEVLCSFENIKIWAITAFKEGYLLGLERKGVLYYDKITKKVSPFLKNNSLFANSIVYDFFKTDQYVYMASEAGFFQLSTDGNIVKKCPFPLKEKVQMTCFSIQKNKHNPQQLLLATLNGIWIYDFQKRRILPFLKDKKYERKKYLSAYYTKNGVWASTEEGIWHFDDSGNLMKIYTVADGLTSNECNRLAHYQDENDILYFGGINGLNILNPSDFSTVVEKKYSLSIDSIYIYQDTTKKRVLPVNKTQYLQLNRGENTVRLIFSYEDFKYSCDKKYYYRTNKSLTKEWELLIDRKLLLNNIEYGNSTIEIMVVSCDDFLNADIQKITLNRPNPLYLTWLFWVIMLVLIALLTWGIIKFSIYQLKRRNELLQQKVDEQTVTLQESLKLKETILGLLVHDVRYPVQSFYGITKKMEYLIKNNDTERLLLLGAETEDKSRKVLWLIDELVYWVKGTNSEFKPSLKECHLGKLIEQIFEIYADELQRKNLHYTLANGDTIGRIEQSLFVIVMRNLIFNAVVHSKSSSEIRVSIAVKNNNFQIVITNEVKENDHVSDVNMGVGMILLRPILKKANFKILNSQHKNIFKSTLFIKPQK